ncbi:MAG: PEP-CTERM sorting domain-containing protein [Pirellulales bacterium]|nr:PEP-CTERM sorting domain-containing protein [Pirellulales bacterium]
MKTLANLSVAVSLTLIMTTHASAVQITRSVTVNGITLQVIRQADPVAGLESYCLRTVTDTALLNTLYLEQPAIDGIVHQCEHTYNSVLQPTVLLAQIREGESTQSWGASGWTDLHTAADTHVLLAEGLSELLIFGTDPPNEGNSGLNPYGLDTNGGLTKISLGQITASTDYSVSSNVASGTEIDVMQVVIPANSAVYFSGEIIGYLGGLETLAATFEDVQVGVPEPSTFVLLTLGVLCLAGVRRRR